MTRKDAIERYFQHNHCARRTLERLMTYDNKMTAVAMAFASKTQLPNIYMIARKYHLVFVNSTANSLQQAAYEKRKKLMQKWNPKLTIRQNAVKLNISHYKAYMLAGEFGLLTSCTKASDTMLRKRARVDELNKKGLNDSAVARVMGITKERVRQIKTIPV